MKMADNLDSKYIESGHMSQLSLFDLPIDYTVQSLDHYRIIAAQVCRAFVGRDVGDFNPLAWKVALSRFETINGCVGVIQDALSSLTAYKRPPSDKQINNKLETLLCGKR
jgi:hypothetical protein